MTALFASAIGDGAKSHNAVTSAIANASAKTGVDFDYLVKQAKVESGMNPAAKAKSSSATGLYQFIDQTWLRMVKTYGADHGWGQYADSIKQKANGDFTVSDPNVRREILNLRKDPKTASLMAGEFAQENTEYLRSRIGREPNNTDLYMAHFLGAGGAGRFINAKDNNAFMAGADLFPDAARANKGVFYKDGRALSLAEIYNRFDKKFNAPTDQNSLMFAQSEPKMNVQPIAAYKAAANQYGSIPSTAFFSQPYTATAYLPDYNQTETAQTDNPIAQILSAPFKFFESLFG